MSETCAENRVLYYRGKPLTDCTRDELLAACAAAYRMLEDERRWHAQDREMDALLRETALAIQHGGRAS
jgi:hypothetical protein